MEENGGDSEALPVVHVLASVLDRLVDANRGHADADTITKFSAAKKPAISTLDYLLRIHRYGRCSPSCFVLGLVYIDRLIEVDAFVVTSLNVHRVIITSLMVAAKFFDDFYFNNAFYARVGGISVLELNELEVDFLRRLGYSLRVTPPEFDRYHYELLLHAEPDPASESTANSIGSTVPGVAAATAAAAAAAAASAAAAESAHPYEDRSSGHLATPNYSGQTLRPNVALPAVSHALGAPPLHARHLHEPSSVAAPVAAPATSTAAAVEAPRRSGLLPWPGTVPWPTAISSAVTAITTGATPLQNSSNL